MKAMSYGYEIIAEKIIGCFSNNYALAHFEPGVSLKHIPWWGAMTLHYFHYFGFEYYEVVLHDAKCIPVFCEARKLNVRQTLQNWCYFKKVVCAKKCYWEEKLEGCVILTSLSQTWIHRKAWSFVHGHQLDCTLYWTVCFCCKPHTTLLSQCFLITPRTYSRHIIHRHLFVRT